ncbi:flagellar hook assembly protein FlgD [Pilimelia columellifera]|uniref:Flagellar hook assembly protein FlgD n=1 Tax=Pilimelia columellifera subsp. columellifera TaxID=706583 RepID=A0ABN3NAJ8_9ACTN
MTNPLSSSTGSPTPINQVLGKFPAQTTGGGQDMGKDTFLKLLVAQLKYQDPMSPSDGTQFLAQTAQFTQVEKLSELAKAQQSMVTAQLTLSASNMVGRTISYDDAAGVTQTGVVTSAMLGSDPTLKVGDKDVPLSSVKEVHK